jgi:hypothetical protein
MNILILLIQLLITTLPANESVPPDKRGIGEKNSFGASAVCPAQNDINESIVEDFLTKSYWSSERTETGTESLTISQITLLTDSGYNSVCTSFNNTYQEMLDEENGLGEPLFNVTYYKAGSFYFVVITIRQSDDPSYISTGVNYITVYNQNLNLVGAYAF